MDPYPNTPPPLISLRSVTKIYPGEAASVPALQKVDLEVFRGEFLGILGKSGAGKTTLLNMISGVDDLSSGKIVVDGLDISNLNETQRARWRGRKLGVIYQSFQLLPSLPLIDNVLLPVDFSGQYHPLRSVQRGWDILSELEIEDHFNKIPSQTSGGQQQRVAIARALANDPPILLADEPTGSLDSATAAIIMRIFHDLVRRGKTILMATHDPGLQEHFSRLITLSDGEIVSGGGRADPVQEMRTIY